MDLLKLSFIKKSISLLLVILGISWVLWLVFTNINGDWQSLLPNNPNWFFITIGLGVLSQFIIIFIFLFLLRRENSKLYFFQVAKLYFTGQIIRYLPGRIWGIIYQTMNASNTFPKSSIILANIELMFLSFSILLTISFSILVYHHDHKLLGFSILTTGFCTTAFILIKGWSSFILEKVKKVIRKNSNKTDDQAPTSIPLSWKKTVFILGIILISWFLYLLGWISLGKSGYGSTPYNMIVLAATYSLSWFIGYISIITPSGLGVRESSFLILGYGIMPSGELALLAIIVRLWLLLTDIILFLSFTKTKISRTRYA